MSRLDDLITFYDLLKVLEARLGGKRRLADSHGRLAWPERGVYFFFEAGESRSESGAGSRVVRVGTHGLAEGSKSTLWQRLRQHRGMSSNGGGNHRGSIFRLLIGSAMRKTGQFASVDSWGIGSDLTAAAKKLGVDSKSLQTSEMLLEIAVSRYIGGLSFLWLSVGDSPGRDSNRGLIERNSIGLLSNYTVSALDAPSATWLGRNADRDRVRRSGLWNNNHVDESYDPAFLQIMEDCVQNT